MTTKFGQIATHPLSEKEKVEEEKEGSLLVRPCRSPSRKVSEAFHSLLDQERLLDDDREALSSDVLSEEAAPVEDVWCTTAHDSPFVCLPSLLSRAIPSVSSERKRLAAFHPIHSKGAHAWLQTVEEICVYAREGHKHEVEITLDRGVFNSTTIKVFYDKKWFVVDIQTGSFVASFLRNGIVDLIHRLFSCALSHIRVLLNYGVESHFCCDQWTGVHGVIKHCCQKTVRDF